MITFYYHPSPDPAKVDLFPNGNKPARAVVDSDAILLALSPQNVRLATATGV